MKNLIYTMIVAILICIGFSFVQADSGHEGAVRIEQGSYVASRAVTVTTGAVTIVWDSSTKRPDSTCINFSAFSIYIGSAASVAHLLATGLPVMASGYFTLGGSMTGVVSATADTSAGANQIQVRCFDGLVR